MRSKLLIIILLSLTASVFSQYSRKEIKIPDILGYKTLKCDFHMHTVFSDGEVWPTVRVEEAWMEGLDVIALTDHFEYLPHKEDINKDFNRAFAIAEKRAKELNVTLIKGGEITRSMPPGHANAIFLRDAALLEKEDWRDVYEEAAEQDAFLFWNHPGWKGQQKDGIPRWYEEHTELFEKKILRGIEIVNEFEYYPEVHRWCLDKGITMLGNSDIHAPAGMVYDFHRGDHRSMTLVFAESNSTEDVKKALLNGRTVVYWNDILIGKEDYLKEIFLNSIEISSEIDNSGDKQLRYVEIKNLSDLIFELSLLRPDENKGFPGDIMLPSNKTIRFTLKLDENLHGNEKVAAPFKIKNLWSQPEDGIELQIVL